ncbi:RiPP maturation radical SAM C-methyltransferase [Bradyrhizobium sp. SZCCHNS3051]|uniref:RiPP maturation radical SAM C-methyltransferase n=1 Tax=Bradyrhizobium sp. SZCCHNS3051 TaxID=3057320 RepID=UPI002916DA51|nr:RiPP maturation radical SAM C-methyltransferase [Bradyrhizobium sp. SZCCHNS3051]
MKRIQLIYPPFGALSFPSIGLSILKAQLVALGHDCRISYLNFAFLDHLPGDLVEQLVCFDLITRRNELGMGDWAFVEAVHGADIARTLDDRFWQSLADHDDAGRLMDVCAAAREAVEPFLNESVNTIDWSEVAVLGLHSIFNQTLASIAIAQRAKAVNPSLVVLFGGPSMQGEVGEEVLRSFAAVDYVVQGEAETVIGKAIGHAMAGEDLADLPGVISRIAEAGGTSVKLRTVPPVLVEDMDSVPLPDYSDYFDRFDGHGYEAHFKPFIPIENARGCWWGAKQHCTFCGLNGETMKFRSKSASRVLDDIERLIARHGLRDLTCVDSILDPSYFRTLLPELARRRLDLSIFYEVKANLNREQVTLLADAGVRLLQPGLEHLSTEVLQLMRKGTSFLQNVQFLKWAQERRLTVFWSVLYGFPGEEWQYYEPLPARMRMLSHLFPPKALVQVRADRFSPLHADWRALGLAAIRPGSGYRHLYPFDDARLARLAYHFDYDYADRPSDLNGRIQAALQPAIDAWNQSYFAGAATLEVWSSPSRVLIRDRRQEGPERLFVLEERAAELYRWCDCVRGRRSALAFYDGQLQRPGQMALDAYLRITDDDLAIDAVLAANSAAALGRPSKTLPASVDAETALQWLENRGLIAREGDRILALACRRDPLRHDRTDAADLRDLVNMSATRRLQLEGVEGLLVTPD